MGYINKTGPLQAIYDLVAFGRDSRFYDAGRDTEASRLHKIKAIERAHASEKKTTLEQHQKQKDAICPLLWARGHGGQRQNV